MRFKEFMERTNMGAVGVMTDVPSNMANNPSSQSEEMPDDNLSLPSYTPDKIYTITSVTAIPNKSCYRIQTDKGLTWDYPYHLYAIKYAKGNAIYPQDKGMITLDRENGVLDFQKMRLDR